MMGISRMKEWWRGSRQILWQYRTDLYFDSCQFEGMTAASSTQPHKISVFLSNLGALFWTTVSAWLLNHLNTTWWNSVLAKEPSQWHIDVLLGGWSAGHPFLASLLFQVWDLSWAIPIYCRRPNLLWGQKIWNSASSMWLLKPCELWQES